MLFIPVLGEGYDTLPKTPRCVDTHGLTPVALMCAWHGALSELLA